MRTIGEVWVGYMLTVSMGNPRAVQDMTSYVDQLLGSEIAQTEINPLIRELESQWVFLQSVKCNHIASDLADQIERAIKGLRARIIKSQAAELPSSVQAYLQGHVAPPAKPDQQRQLSAAEIGPFYPD